MKALDPAAIEAIGHDAAQELLDRGTALPAELLPPGGVPGLPILLAVPGDPHRWYRWEIGEADTLTGPLRWARYVGDPGGVTAGDPLGLAGPTFIGVDCLEVPEVAA